MPSPRLTFLGWSRPLLASAADHLCAGWQGGMLDLSDLLVIVPTSQAGRRLRETLAARALEQESAVLSPLIITPDLLLDWAQEEQPGGATEGEALLAWARCVEDAGLEEYRALFPVDPVRQDFSWALQAAADLRGLRHTLGEAGLGLSEAAHLLGGEHPEAERWAALARLETHCEAVMSARRRHDPGRMRLQGLTTPHLPDEVKRICLIAVPDPIAAAVRILEQLSKRMPVEVLVQAPAEEAVSFDAWGRPLPEAWNERPVPIPDAAQEILTFARPEGEAEWLAEELRRHDGPRGSIALGVADPEVSSPLENLAAGAGIRLFNPEGKPLLRHEICWLLRCLTDLVKSDAFPAAERLLRIPDAAGAIIRTLREGQPDLENLSLRELVQQADDFRAERLPATLASALPLAAHWERSEMEAAELRQKTVRHYHVHAALNWLAEAAESLRSANDFSAALGSLLAFIYRERRHRSAKDAREFDAAATHLSRALHSISEGTREFAPRLPVEARLDLLLHLLEGAQIFPDPAGGEIDLQGWLELPWEDAPRLCIAGMNEGRVPESVSGDRWLPDSARTALGLRTNESRFARDVFHLTAIIETRRQSDGRLTLLTARETSSGDPLKPSRLLLACADEELPVRARQLFSEGPEQPHREVLAWQRAWMLRPPAPSSMPVMEQLSVTKFSDWLQCPFRFYLKHVLRMEPWEPLADEMDVRAFGNLLHHCMETLHADESLRDSTDAAAITALLHGAAAQRLHQLHGSLLPVPLLIQLEAAQNRLTAAARLHAEARAEGWRYHFCEVDFPSLPGSTETFTVEGMEVRGRIDLIEKHADGRIRILDYKTFSNPRPPVDKHTSSVPRQPPRELHDFELFHDGESQRRWLDLQLPLYAYVARKVWGERVDVGYVLLPRASSEAKIEMWEGLDRATLDAAYTCACGIVREIRAGNFWPPAERTRYDDFESLFFRGAAESVEPDWQSPKEPPVPRKKRKRA